MNIYRTFSAAKSIVVVLIMFLFIPLVGCDDDPMAPCYDCDDTITRGRYTACIERSFDVDGTVTVTVDNFVGSVTYRTGNAGCVRVKAIKRATRRSHLDDIDVRMSCYRNQVDIRTCNPRNIKNVSVDLEITVPPGARPQLTTGVGDIDYHGRPEGVCRFTTGVGSVTLRLRADVNITVELSAGVGSIFVGFPVDGVVSNHPSFVKGTIGNGGEGNLCASTGVGSIYLNRL